MHTEETYEIVDMWEENGIKHARVRYANGSEIIRIVKSVTLEGQITRADGTVEPKQVLAVTHQNPITEARLQEEHGAGKVTLRCE